MALIIIFFKFLPHLSSANESSGIQWKHQNKIHIYTSHTQHTHTRHTQTHATQKDMVPFSLWWRHNGHEGVSKHQPHDCLLNCLFRRRSKKTSKLRITGLCVGNSPGTSEFPAQMASDGKMFTFDEVIMWWISITASTRRGNFRSFRCSQGWNLFLIRVTFWFPWETKTVLYIKDRHHSHFHSNVRLAWQILCTEIFFSTSCKVATC